MTDVILAFVTSHPGLLVLGTVITVLRTVFHPLMKVIESGVASSGDAKALDVLNEVEASKTYTTLVAIVDWATSIDISTILAGLAAKNAAPATPASK